MASKILPGVAVLLMTLSMLMFPVSSQDARITASPADQSVEQFSAALMRCTVSDLPLGTQTVSWMVDGTVISSDGSMDADAMEDVFGPGPSNRYEILIGYKVPVFSADLNITSAQGVDDGRQYKCIVCGRSSDTNPGKACDGRIKLESEAATLEVNYRPDIQTYPLCNSTLPDNADIPRESDTNTLVVLGQAAILNCTSDTAKPPVALAWSRNGNELDGDTTSREANGFSHLEHRFVADLSDNGVEYTCRLRSEYFNLEQECVLPPIKVVSYPTVIISSPGAISAGRSHEFVCKASSNTTTDQSYTYEWKWDATFSKPVVNTTKYGSVLSTNALNDDDGDQVRCTVTDSDGLQSSAVARIVIKGELSIGAIIGIAMAGVCVIGLIGLGIFLVVRKKNKDKKKKEEPAPPSAVPMLPSSLKPASAADV